MSSVLLSEISHSVAARAGRNLVRVNGSTLYAFLNTAYGLPGGATSNTLYYRKSTDNGRTWGHPTQVGTSNNLPLLIAVWWDQDTPGNSGTVIHITYMATADDIVFYKSLDTASDTLGSAITVFDGASATVNSTVAYLTICRAVGGNIYIAFDIDGGTETGFYRSTDAGASFGSRTNVWEASFDKAHIVPANLADTQDIWAVYVDMTADEVTLKTYDDSANSWSETSAFITGATMVSTVSPVMDVVVRKSDGHLFLAIWPESSDAGTEDLEVWQIDGAGSITQLTDVVTNADDCSGVALAYDQTTQVMWVIYIGKSDGSETLFTNVGVYGKRSTDHGATWESEVEFHPAGMAHNWLATSCGGRLNQGMPDLLVQRFTTAVVFLSYDWTVGRGVGRGL